MRSVHISMEVVDEVSAHLLEVVDETALSVATWRPPGLMADWQLPIGH